MPVLGGQDILMISFKGSTHLPGVSGAKRWAAAARGASQMVKYLFYHVA